MAQYKGFTFDGINSADYGVVITGASTYSAPERAVEMFDIPGRNGALAIDQGRFANIEITYHCAMADRNQATFAQRLSALRNQLCSRYSYVRLTDDYNADEYRLALYKSGLDADLVIDRGGEFDVVFDCKPQRFLTSGESTYQIGEWGQTITETGDIVTYQGDDLTAVKSLTTTLEPIQSGSGTPSPDNIRPITGRTGQTVTVTGKNLLPNIAATSTVQGVTFTVNEDKTITANGTSTGWTGLTLGTFLLRAGNYKLVSLVSDSDKYNYYLSVTKDGTSLANTSSMAGGSAFTLAEDSTLSCKLYARPNVALTNSTCYPMIILASETNAYEPYTGTTYTRAFTDSQGNALTVYGGEDEIVGGLLTVNYVQLTDDLTTRTWYDWVSVNNERVFYAYVNGTQLAQADPSKIVACNKYKAMPSVPANAGAVQNGNSTICFRSAPNFDRIYIRDDRFTSTADFKNSLSDLQVVYPLAEPEVHQLTPNEVTTLIGTNHVWSDAGEVTVEYGTDPYTMVNDTPFPSKPLIRVTGYGEVGFGDITITITGTAGVVTYIDCDLMECYRMSGGAIVPANQYVTFTGTDFPTIPTGKTRVTSASTISKVEVVPRWWII